MRGARVSVVDFLRWAARNVLNWRLNARLNDAFAPWPISNATCAKMSRLRARGCTVMCMRIPWSGFSAMARRQRPRRQNYAVYFAIRSVAQPCWLRHEVRLNGVAGSQSGGAGPPSRRGSSSARAGAGQRSILGVGNCDARVAVDRAGRRRRVVLRRAGFVRGRR